MLPTWNQNSYFCFRTGKFWSAAPIFVVLVAVVLVFVVLVVVVLVVLVVVRGRWGKVTTLVMRQKKVVTGGNGPIALSVVLVTPGEIGKCQ